ncbi:DEAD/DEAH box helicase [Sandaracinus amylolyticus]|uniref:Putative ATP-dependent helicase lhr n=1 Tax=Sandaracinus amylolyticus TaxID=927083 RepID=A0A0F6YJ19_9BACT|nr:DEAD/DEAH box helicase [Sandaracinus amylolyticus]AKF07382.1 Putative ATP-dependent helicase lhr [Sandaracinus amylolyticus]
MSRKKSTDALAAFHPATRAWFEASFPAPTDAQRAGWGAITRGESTLLLAPTGSGKTLAAFLFAIDRATFADEPAPKQRCRVLYVSPLKALAVDVERNLRAPLAGITATAERLGIPFRRLEVGVRSGDTPADERARLARRPPDVLITTPESLYLLLTSNARETLTSIETVIVDEIHAIAGTKRGAHLALTLERLEEVRARAGQTKPLQRIGLSATQRPLDEIARFLGGGELDDEGKWSARSVRIVDASAKKDLALTIEVPVDDMSRLGSANDRGPLEGGPPTPEGRSIWPSIHPRLVELIRAHRSTMVFVNSRRLAERLATALNDVAGDEIALAHHGSVAREQRQQIEERLKSGALPCIVATSSLELGLDLGAVDLVIQIETPPTVSAGLQRIGRASHHVGGTSEGVVFPKHRADLLASAAAVRLMRRGEVEPTAYPRSPLDVLAQQLVAIVASDEIHEAALFTMVRRAAPFAELSRGHFEGVLDMLAGRYPSDEFAELRPRIVWDRVTGQIRARQGAKRLAVVNAGVIPDRGLYGVFLAGSGEGKTSRRVGELDEEMVFEAREGEVFLLGATSWRIVEITHDRVMVEPAPGEPGKMPFWRGESLGRSAALGTAIGALTRTLARAKEDDGIAKLMAEHDLEERAARNLVRFVQDQAKATGEVPSDRTLLVERFVDEVGDHRVCLMSPFGARVHAPLATCLMERCRAELGIDTEAVWSDDGIVLRFPESDAPPTIDQLLPTADEVEDLLVRTLGSTALFSSRFRECAARALLLPRRHPGRRSPLWAQRRRAADLLQVASRYGSFPILLETYRECLRDVFDLPGVLELLRAIADRRVHVVTVDTAQPSPFAASLLFSYVANFMYEGDAPLAERRAQALTVDAAQLRELLGGVELRELLDPDAITALEHQLQRLDRRYAITGADGVHDLLLLLGDLDRDEIAMRVHGPDEDEASARARSQALIAELLRERRVIEVTIGGRARLAAIEDAGRLRDALGVPPPPGTPAAFLEPVADPLGDLVSRWSRTHGPFRAGDLAARWGLGIAPVRAAIDRLIARGRLIEGELVPGARGLDLCDAEVLRSVKRRSLARLRAEIEPVEPAAYTRFLLEWNGIAPASGGGPRRGVDALFRAIEQLEGAPVPADVLEREILPARVDGYRQGDLDQLCASGEVVWRGVEPLAPGVGRVAIYFASSYPLLAPPPVPAEGALTAKVRDVLSRRGALFFAEIAREVGGFPQDALSALWDLVWSGEVTNDTLAPLRSLGAASAASKRDRRRPSRFQAARRVGPPGSEGRWSLLPSIAGPSETERRAALARTLLERHGVVTREGVQREGVVGGFGAVYPVLRTMEEAGRVRRGFFVAGLGAAQFALPGADDRLRAHRDPAEPARTFVIAATDPAQPYGAALPWPETRATARPQRASGAQVVLREGRPIAWMGRTERSLITFLPEAEPERGHAIRAIARALAELVESGRRKAILIASVDGEPTHGSPIVGALRDEGFTHGLHGYLKRSAMPVMPSRVVPMPVEPFATADVDEGDDADLDDD